MRDVLFNSKPVLNSKHSPDTHKRYVFPAVGCLWTNSIQFSQEKIVDCPLF